MPEKRACPGDFRHLRGLLLRCGWLGCRLEFLLGSSVSSPGLMSETAHRADRAEIARLVEHAEKLLQKGKTAEALEEYLRILAGDPGNDGVRQMAADLCLSLQ